MGLLDKAGKYRSSSGQTEHRSENADSETPEQSSSDHAGPSGSPVAATGLLHRAEAERQTSGNSAAHHSSANEAIDSSPASDVASGISSTPSSTGLLHRAEQARQSPDSGGSSVASESNADGAGGLLHRAEQARRSGGGESSGSGARPPAGSGLLSRALYMRESMKGLLQRASEMRDREEVRTSGAIDEATASTEAGKAPVSDDALASQSIPEMSGVGADSGPELEDTTVEDSLLREGTEEFISVDEGSDFEVPETIEPDLGHDESVEFLDEDAFAEIQKEAKTAGEIDHFEEPEISPEALQDFEASLDSEFGTDHALEDTLPAADGLQSPEDFQSSDQENAEAAQEQQAVPQSDLDLMEQIQDGDLDEDFPDLDLQYRSPEESDDPALASEDDSDTHELDPFSNWEKEALEQAEEEARGLQTSDAEPRKRDESFLYEDTHPMTTLPAEAHIASQRKIDHYMALFDLLRELQDVQELDEFWDALSYGILGQLGANRLIVFAPNDEGKNQIFYPVAYLGVNPADNWALKPGDEIYDRLRDKQEIHYTQEFQKGTSTISDLEKEILEAINAQVVAPIGQPGSNAGVIMVGPNMEGVDYTLDDLEYLKLLGEMSAGALHRIHQRIQRDEQSEQNQTRLELYERILSASRQASQVKNLDDVYDVLLNHLKDDFGVESASLVLLNVPRQEYTIFAGNEISPESLEKFSLPVSSDLIGTISNLTRLYDFADFRENQEITSCYSNDDLALMQNYWIVPLINLNWLVGFITIHRTSRPWTQFDRELALATAEFFAPIMANCIILGERETLFRDPFSPVVERLRKELNRGAQFQTPVSLVEVRVKNLKRLLSLNEPESVTSFLQDLSRSIGGLLFDTDFLARVGQGRFALILPGRNSQEADIFIRKMQAEFKRLNLLSGSPVDVQYSFQSVSSPDDSSDPEKMLAYLDP